MVNVQVNIQVNIDLNIDVYIDHPTALRGAANVPINTDLNIVTSLFVAVCQSLHVRGLWGLERGPKIPKN